MKHLATLCIAVCISITLHSQEYLGGETYTFFPGTQEPNAAWNTVAFDDSNWQLGYKCLGYGNTNDSTQLSGPLPSVYIRIPFEIAEAQAVEKMNLLCDYDDGFIAYINGVEVLRVNMGIANTPSSYTMLATRSHEKIFTRQHCSPLLGYYIDSTILKTCLLTGENILAIEVHNDSLTGSDLGFECTLRDISQKTYNPYSWEFFAIKQISVDSSKLPIVKVFTDEFGIDNCDKKVTAHMQIIHNAQGLYNYYTDVPSAYDGPIGIEPRGQSSLGWAKKNYSVETRDADGNDTSVVLLGMPAENDWVFHGPLADRSLIRNALAYHLSNSIGQYAPRTQFCELFLNDEYLGVYVCIEKIKRDKHRVDIEKLPATATVNVTGGYILKYDKDTYGNIGIVYPADDEITQIQTDYITGFMLQFQRSLHDSVLLTERGYKKYIDIPSYLDFTIINELAKNPDAFLNSTYMHKNSDDFDSKLHYGPVWDFDLAFGNSNFQNAMSTNGWQFSQSTNGKLQHKKIFKDTAMVRQFNERWEYLRNNELRTEKLISDIDSMVAYLGPAIERNKQAWMLENHYILNLWGFNVSLTYEEDIATMKQWLTERTAWMDENISKIYYPYNYKPTDIATFEKLENSAFVYPNPCSEFICVNYTLELPTHVIIRIQNILGETIYNETNNHANAGTYSQVFPLQSVPNGTYIVSILANNTVIKQVTCIKK